MGQPTVLLPWHIGVETCMTEESQD